MNIEQEKKLTKIKHSFWGFFVERRAVSWLLAIGIIISGILAFTTLPREIQPEINIPIGGVSVILPGANPEDVESLVTEPMEKEISTISDIKNLSSSSSSGNSLIIVEFEAEADFDKNMQDLKDAVDRAKPDLPEDATEPFVIRAEANDFSIVTYSLMGDLPVYELSRVAEDVQAELEKVSGVSKALIVGSQTEEIDVEIDPNKLDAYGLTINQVANMIEFANTNLPLGLISMDELNYSVRIDNRFESLEDIGNIPLLNLDGTSILLKDIATIRTNYPKQNVITKLSIKGGESMPAVSIQIYKKDGGNILDIVDRSKIKIAELETGGMIPENVNVAVSNDNSLFIRSDLSALTDDGVETAVMIFIILLLALGLREGLIAGLSVPLTFLLTFAVMDFFGLTLNSLSLFSLLIGLGITVDTAIVIMQGVHENIHKGTPAKESALIAIQTYKWPLIVGSLTNMFAFSPMLLVSGILGEFLRTMPIVISAALIGSLVINLTIIPAASAKFLHTEKLVNKSTRLEQVFNWIGQRVHNTVEKLLNSRPRRVLLILSMIVLFTMSMFLPISGILKAELFPQTDQQYFIVRVETPIGSVIENTEKITEKVEKELYRIPEIDNFLTIMGSNQSPALSEGITVGGGIENSHLANITVNLVDKEERSRKSYDIANSLEEKLQGITNAKITVSQLQEGPPTESPVTVRITGTDLKALKKLSADIEKAVKETEGTKNVSNSLKIGVNEFKYTLDPEILSYHGLSALQVAATIRGILQSVKADTVTLNGEDNDIMVSYQLPEKNGRQNLSLEDLENFEIPTPSGNSVTLGQLGKYYFGSGIESISREDQKRIIKITSELQEGANAVDVTKKIQEKIDNMQITNGQSVSFGGDLEEIAESFNDLYRSMSVGVLLILFALVLQFNSFKQPLIILITLPLGLIGVFPGLLLLGLNLSFPAFLGVVALCGIVVNNAIVLIDRINENRGNGMEFKKSIAEASNSRFQAIFLTTLSNIVGLLPLALSNEFWAGLGFSIIFGLTFSTVLTLVVIPTLYYIFEAKKALKYSAE